MVNRRKLLISAAAGVPVMVWLARQWGLDEHWETPGAAEGSPPFGRPIIDMRPFVSLQDPRAVERDDLPPDLLRFYERHEGVGLESSPERDVRLCKLAEVKEYAWRDVPIFGADAEPGWGEFRGLYIGVSSFHDGIYWVRKAPCCPAGSILTIGPDIAGPGGGGDHTIEPSLVLAASFDEWIDRLGRYRWTEFGLAPGSIDDLPAAARPAVRSYYRALNPAIRWESAPPLP